MKILRLILNTSLILLFGVITIGMGGCPTVDGVRVFVTNLTDNNFHIDSPDGMRVIEGMTSSKPVFTLTKAECEKSFEICRETVGCRVKVTVDAYDYFKEMGRDENDGEEEEGVLEAAQDDPPHLVNTEVFIKETEPMVFEAYCETEMIYITVDSFF